MEKNESKEQATSLNPSFQPNLKSSAITQHQRAKFQELQKRRLKVQTKAKNKIKSKGSSNFRYNKDRVVIEDAVTQASADDHRDESLKDSSVNPCPEGKDSGDVSLSSSLDDVHPALRKKKLHWGLDTKARWERKANM